MMKEKSDRFEIKTVTSRCESFWWRTLLFSYKLQHNPYFSLYATDISPFLRLARLRFHILLSTSLSPSQLQVHPSMETTQGEEHQHLMVDVDVIEARSKFRVRELSRDSDTGAPILCRVCLDIPKGLIVGIIGPSGSGKSTLLRSLNRLWEPPAGTVFLDGQDICDLDVVNLRRKVGMLFQLPVLFEGTVADNVRYGPHLRGEKLTDSEVHKLLTLADLDHSFASKAGGELSVGQAQRVALARTLANEPEVLLLDEPTSALDPISTQNIEDAILKLKKSRGMTTIIVSHSVKQIQRIADVVCLLVNGEVVEVLKPEHLSQAQHPMAQKFLELSS